MEALNRQRRPLNCNCTICGAGYGIRPHPRQAVILIDTSCACARSQPEIADWETVRRALDMGEPETPEDSGTSGDRCR